MHTLGNVSVRLLQQLSHHQDDGCRSITGNVVLCGRSPGNHDLCHVSYQDETVYRMEDSLRQWGFGFAAEDVRIYSIGFSNRNRFTYHLPQQHISILSQFDLYRSVNAAPLNLSGIVHTPPAPSTSLKFVSHESSIAKFQRQNIHLQRPRRTQVGFQDILKTLTSADVHLQGLGSPLCAC